MIRFVQQLLLLLITTLHYTSAADADGILRVAVFGGGAGGSHSENRAFLLGDAQVDNYAASSSSSNYDAVCLESIVGPDNIYDVVLLNHSVANSNVRKLAQRLRQRYPQAVIIFINHYDLITTVADDDDNYNIMIDNMSNLLNDYAQEVNGHVVDLRDHSKGRIVDYYRHHHYYYGAPQRMLLTDVGQLVLSERIQTLLNEQEQHIFVPTTGTTMLGDFTGGDYCQVWITNGDDTDITHQSDGMKEFQRGKYAMEFSSSSSDGVIDIVNPFAEKRRLFISFLVSNTPGDYPTTIVHSTTPNSKTRGGGGTNIRSIDVYPVGSQEQPSSSAAGDYVKTIAIGFISPGKHKLHIQPEAGNAVHPFRLVGLTIGNEQVAPDIYDFVSVSSD